MIKDVIRLKWEARLSHDKIATALGISKGVVQKYVALAGAAKLDWDEVRDWDEQRLQQALLPVSRPPSGFVEPDWARVHQDLQRQGVTLMLLWQEYTEAHPGFCSLALHHFGERNHIEDAPLASYGPPQDLIAGDQPGF
jgi:transposase